MYKAQLSLEVLIAMLISMLIVFVVLGYFLSAHNSIAKTSTFLSRLANLTSSYPAALRAG